MRTNNAPRAEQMGARGRAQAMMTKLTATAAFVVAALMVTGVAPTTAHAGKGWQQATLPHQAVQVATGMVTGVADGDTCYVMIAGRSTRVRLAAIDAPEKAQAFGRRSEQSLRELVGKREVKVTWSEEDSYGRPLVQISVDGLDVNAEQVKRGMAWVYRQYSKDPALNSHENAARAAKLGLWVDPDPVAPWVWRRNAKSPATAE